MTEGEPMYDEVTQALRSIVAITVTPFDDAGRLDEDAYSALVTRLVEAGVGVITPNGNTSEFYSLTPVELDRAVALTVAASAGRARVVTGVGYDLERAVELARAAARAGADGVMVHQPVHPYQSVPGWVAYHRAIADAVPECAVVCYVRNPYVTAAGLAELAAACPNVTGVKYAVPDAIGFAALAAAVGAELGPDRLAWVCGLAEVWAPFYWAGGARGFTSGLVNVAPDASLALLARLRDGDSAGAMELWSRLKPLEDMRAARGNADNVSVVKEALAQLGLCGRGVRPPISELPEAERAEVARHLEQLLVPAGAG